MSKGQQQRNLCDQTKAGLIADNENLSEKIEAVLLAMKQEEFLVQNMRQTEKLVQTSMENIFGYMQIADWTLFNDLTRSRKPLPSRETKPSDEGFGGPRPQKDRESEGKPQRNPSTDAEELREVRGVLERSSARRRGLHQNIDGDLP